MTVWDSIRGTFQDNREVSSKTERKVERYRKVSTPKKKKNNDITRGIRSPQLVGKPKHKIRVLKNLQTYVTIHKDGHGIYNKDRKQNKDQENET